MHGVSSPPLLALKPQPSSDCMGGKLALALAAAELFCCRGIPCTISVWTPRDSRWELGRACLHLPPNWEVARVASSHAEGRAEMKLYATTSPQDQMPFDSHLCSFLGFTFLFYTFLLSLSSTHDFLSCLFLAVFSSLNCWASSLVSRAYLLDPFFPFSVPAPTTPVDDFALVAAPAGCLLSSVAMMFLSIHDVFLHIPPSSPCTRRFMAYSMQSVY